ncbi:MAG TPA: type II toxin-antitoxin system HicB family antitoxin [Thermoanaerobaculia bacterium]|nr:type II toxin-antitoxin system HicB family antitoxin [Thermoanaerobaculia bacterium]
MSREFAYPVLLTPDEVDGGFVVTFPDIPEAVTQGEDVADALAEAADALEEAIAGRIRRGDQIPEPSPAGAEQSLVPVPALTAAKAALYLALREAGIAKSELAERLGCDEKEVRRLLDPQHPSKLPRIQKALAALGKSLALRLVDEAA